MEGKSSFSRDVIEVLTTGGTFDTQTDGRIGAPRAEAVLGQARATIKSRCRELMRIDSSLMQDSHRKQIRDAVLASGTDRLVIIHGTDTLLETANFLRDVPGKVVVITGSFVPADSHPGDAAFNLGAALTAVQLLPVGVHIVMGGESFLPSEARKNAVLRKFERI